MVNIIVAGCGTGVGKTVVSSILVSALKGDYWKPISCGPYHKGDFEVIKHLAHSSVGTIHPCSYHLKAPLSPHHAARLEHQIIESANIVLPNAARHLIIEMVGGIMVPLNHHLLAVDLFRQWNAKWVIVSRHYLGSINHTLMTIAILKSKKIDIAGIVFNGTKNPDTEEAILNFSNLPLLGHLYPHPIIEPNIVKIYAKQWKNKVCEIIC